VRREALRPLADGVGEALEIAGEGHAGRGGPGGREDGRRRVENVEQARHDLVVVERDAGLEDGRKVSLQRPHLRLGNRQPRPLQARLGDVRAEHPLRDYLGLDPDLLPTPRLVQHGEAAVEGVEPSCRPAVPDGDFDEPLAAEPELQLHGEARPLLGYSRVGREPHRDAYLRPEVSRLDPLRLPVTGDEPPALHRALVGVAPEAQLLDAAGVTLQTLAVVGLHRSPYCRHDDTSEILPASSRFAHGPLPSKLTVRCYARVERQALHRGPAGGEKARFVL
jgi:hypothetical protein